MRLYIALQGHPDQRPPPLNLSEGVPDVPLGRSNRCRVEAQTKSVGMKRKDGDVDRCRAEEVEAGSVTVLRQA